MFVKHLTLSHFRNHKNTDLPLEPGVNLLVGPNGQGKTNVVEAIEYVSTLSSHRVAGYQALIHKDAAQAIVRLKVSHQDRDVLVDIELSRENSNQLRINQSPVNRMRDVLGTVQARVSEAAVRLGITTGNLIDFLASDPKVFEQANILRKQFGHKPLHE